MSLYHPLILEHDRAPRNLGPLPGATHTAALDNPLCGDQVAMHLEVRDGIITAVGFEGRGCAVARAAASMWTERLRGLAVAESVDLLERFAAFCAEPPGSPVDEALSEALGELAALVGVRAAKARRTCATLAARAVTQALAREPKAPDLSST